MVDWLIYIPLVAGMAAGGYHVKSLTKSGAAATFLVGILTALGFGWRGLIIMGAFFVSSSEWSSFRKQQKKQVEELVEKGAARDWLQVAANGSIAAAAAFLYFLTDSDLWIYTFCIAVAAANSDTWASEIGVLSKNRPYNVFTWRKADRGTSGAVSLLGTFAAFGGAIFIGIVSAFVFGSWTWSFVMTITVFGFIGCLADTILGATIQSRYTCRSCGLSTEKTVHCEERTIWSKGIRWCDNDIVNMGSILIAAAAGSLFMIVLNF